MEISQLQSTLESHVVAQSEEISRLHDESIRTTETVRSGNQQLKKVTQAGVEFRNFMIFFMLILSFTLLFLHWYD
jgi:syntaxin 18